MACQVSQCCENLGAVRDWYGSTRALSPTLTFFGVARVNLSILLCPLGHSHPTGRPGDLLVPNSSDVGGAYWV